MPLQEIIRDEIVPLVERPSRYAGCELNSVHKDPASVEFRAALAFPDLYDMALGNLGLLILYGILNEEPWIWCERAYTPAADMDKLLRERGLPLFTHESKTALRDMDLVGFTLQSELTYTTILDMLDLAGIPPRAAYRGDDMPLVCAGGPTSSNPEPMAPFMDFFVIGDGEDVVLEVARALRAVKGLPRIERLEALASIEGVYIPSLCPVEETEEGWLVPSADAPRIRRRIVKSLDQAAFPVRYIVPFAQQIHDRVSLEVMRGCTQGCRFCHAGMTTRPVRERTTDAIEKIMTESLDHTGYEELSLVSLSTCDYSMAPEMVSRVARLARPRNVSVSLPSLRLDTFAVELADMVADVRRSGLTFAPEAATDRLRAVINKRITEEQLFSVARETFRRGWNHLKTYFMIGLPTETDEDVAAIPELCGRVLREAKNVNRRAQLNTGVSTFVPKPHTPFQWAAQIPPEETDRRQAILRAGFKDQKSIKFGRHNPTATFIEGLISRGDRRTADLIEAAWRHGARLETWDERINLEPWRLAIEELGFDAERAIGPRGENTRLPWDHIDMLVAKDWLRAEWDKAREAVQTPDCRWGVCSSCGVRSELGEACDTARSRAAAGSGVVEPQPPQPTREEPEPVQRIRFRIGRQGEARFLSHLELVNAWVRALRRAGAPMAHSQGFHIHPRVNFSTAAPVGEESRGDYMDVILIASVDPGKLLVDVRKALPQGLIAMEAGEASLKAPSLMDSVVGFSYMLRARVPAEIMAERVAGVLAATNLPMRRKAKESAHGGKGREGLEVDVRPMIQSLEMAGTDGDCVLLRIETRMFSKRGIRANELLSLLGLTPPEARFLKLDTLLI